MKKVNGVIKPYTDGGEEWRDGSFLTDIPERTLQRLFHVKFSIVSQANPHITCFFYNSRGSAGKPTKHRSGLGYRGGFILSSVVRWIRLDLQKWLSFIRDLRLLPKVAGIDPSNIFLQKFEGSVTILPTNPTLWDYLNAFEDPSKKRLAQYVRDAELRTWPTICMIKNRVIIEELFMNFREKYHSNSSQNKAITFIKSNHASDVTISETNPIILKPLKERQSADNVSDNIQTFKYYRKLFEKTYIRRILKYSTQLWQEKDTFV